MLSLIENFLKNLDSELLRINNDFISDPWIPPNFQKIEITTPPTPNSQFLGQADYFEHN